MSKNLILTCFLSLGIVIPALAQVYTQNTLYPYSRFMYNPAVAGTQNGTNVTLLGRLQWLGIDGGPRLFATSVNTPLPRLQSGVGASVMSDVLGPLSTTSFTASYAYHLPLIAGDVNGPTLSFGVAGGILQKRIDSKFIYDQTGGIDPLVPTSPTGTVVNNLAAGIYFRLPDDKFFIGISGQDLLEPSLEGLTQTSGIGEDSKVSRSFYLMSGYRYDFQGTDLSVQPTVLARTDGTSYQFDLSAYLTYKSLVIFGLSHRFYNDSFSAMAGFKVTDDMFIGYSYDYTVSELNANGDLSSHELVLSYTFQTPERRGTGIDNVIKKRN